MFCLSPTKYPNYSTFAVVQILVMIYLLCNNSSKTVSQLLKLKSSTRFSWFYPTITWKNSPFSNLHSNDLVLHCNLLASVTTVTLARNGKQVFLFHAGQTDSAFVGSLALLGQSKRNYNCVYHRFNVNMVTWLCEKKGVCLFIKQTSSSIQMYAMRLKQINCLIYAPSFKLLLCGKLALC